MPLCVKGVVWGAVGWPVLGGWVGRSVGGGFGSDRSEVPVYQGVSRPRWIQESSLVVLPDPPLFSVDPVVGVGDEVSVDDV